MTRTFYLLLILVLPCVSNAQSWKIFADTGIAFTAKYPASWVNKVKEEKRVFFTSPPDGEKDDFRENINISVKTNAAYGTELKIKEVVSTVIESLKKSIDNFNLQAENYFKWNNADAVELIYGGTYDINGTSTEVRITQWFCFWNTKLYTATYTALKGVNTHDETAKKILKSILFK
ncbi:MAG: hypothetical protein IPK57_14045 [Chitinophagaceae bacterium]|nr:hypothetical protein [Chitinophagaceae bacterium]